MLKKKRREKLIIKSIPYQVNKSLLIEKIAQLVKIKRLRVYEIYEMSQIERVLELLLN